jgi:hypothetical protein
VVLHPQSGKRVEARENGMMLILAEEDLSLLTQAQLYLETWGGYLRETALPTVRQHPHGLRHQPLISTALKAAQIDGLQQAIRL